MERFRVQVGKDGISFSACHLISFSKKKCESLHGHNFRLAVEVEAPCPEAGLVLDFLVLRRIVLTIAAELDHRVLLPLESPHFTLEENGRTVQLAFGEKAWVFPRGDCALLPVENTTSELLARWVAQRVLQDIEALRTAGDLNAASPVTLCVELEDSPGQCVRYETDAAGRGGGS